MIEAKTAAGDTGGAEEVRKAWLKGMVQFKQGAARAQQSGNNPAAQPKRQQSRKGR